MFAPPPINPYRDWLDLPLGGSPANHYELLGLAPLESDLDAISVAVARQFVRLNRAKATQHHSIALRVLTELQLAERCLLDPETKQEYDRRLRGERSSRPRWRVLSRTSEEFVEPPPVAALEATQPFALATTSVGLPLVATVVLVFFSSLLTVATVAAVKVVLFALA